MFIWLVKLHEQDYQMSNKSTHVIMYGKITNNFSSPPGSSIHGIFQVRILEWVAISFSKNYLRCELLDHKTVQPENW